MRPRFSKRRLKSSHTSIETSCKSSRSSARDKPLASLEEFEVDAPALVDTGCNGFIASSKSQLDKTSNSSNFSQVTVGMPDSSIVSSAINGEFTGYPALVVKEFNTSLVPADFFTTKNALLIVIDNKMYAVRITRSTRAKITELLTEADCDGSLLLTILRKNGLYPTTTSALRNAFDKKPQIESVRQSVVANASYFSAKLSSMEQAVLFWHVTLGHPSKAKLISMIENKVLDGFPLSTQQVKDHFTECPDCFHGNLSQKRHPREANRVYVTGKTLSIDVIVGGGNKQHPVRTHSGEGFAVLCIDRGSDKSWFS